MDIQNLDESLLFKFTPINFNLIRLLINSEIWFSSPHLLNDPFEVEFEMERMKELPSDDFLLSWYKEKSSFKHSENEAKWRIEKIKNNPPLFYSDLKADLQIQYYNRLKISCYSLAFNEILLWSHYADEHKGICLIFDKDLIIQSAMNDQENTSLNFVGAQKITYCKSKRIKAYLDKNEFRLPIKNLRDSNFKKLRCWKYEKEFRIIYKDVFNSIPNGIELSFPKKALKGVIFGERCSNSDIELLYSILNKFEYIDSCFFLGVSKIVPSSGKLVSNHWLGQIDIEDFIWRRKNYKYKNHN